jgi:hypothetical protein
MARPSLRITPGTRTVIRTFPNPETMDWQDWVDTMVGFNGRSAVPMLASSDDDWREFADRIALIVPDAPGHDEFQDWREWAHALRASLSL